VPASIKKIRKTLDKLLKEKGIYGYSIHGQKITIYVEDEAAKQMINMAMFEGYELEFILGERFEAF